MHDFTFDEIEEVAIQLQFNLFLQQQDVNAVVENLQRKFPVAFFAFIKNAGIQLDLIKDTLSETEYNYLLDSMMMNFVLIMHTLDISNNGGQEQEQDGIPEESHRCQFAQLSEFPCNEDAIIDIELNGENVWICRKHVIEWMRNALRIEEEDDIIAGLEQLPIEVMLKAILHELPNVTQDEYRRDILSGWKIKNSN